MAYIREEKRGTRRYYYLVESYRDKETGKVRTRKLKYLGAKLPYGVGAFGSDQRLREWPKNTLTDLVEMGLRRGKREKTEFEKQRDLEKSLSRALDKLEKVNDFDQLPHMAKLDLIYLKEKVNKILPNKEENTSKQTFGHD